MKLLPSKIWWRSHRIKRKKVNFLFAAGGRPVFNFPMHKMGMNISCSSGLTSSVRTQNGRRPCKSFGSRALWPGTSASSGRTSGLMEHEDRDVVIAVKTEQAIRNVIAKALKNLNFLWSRGIIDKHEGSEVNEVRRRTSHAAGVCRPSTPSCSVSKV